ncbi:hypothetical protein DPMN_137900 [Dreissena polymorpha]|uniref:Major facilitator superfamily (MFS) profile domain-containing protein n=1 Tax=Dreissena polymorpha TaxID=45954 RepID=A0A9D4JJ99_DREPO|nr:hypothetical protein DPMN_137900 [Dreissena polymorpha]
MIPKTTNRRDIDSGWAWVVLVAVYLGMVIYCFLLYMSGILYIALLDRYGESETKTSLVGAISTGLLCFLGPFAGGLNNKFSCRFSIVIGGFLTSVGCCASALASSLDVIIVTAGVLVGAGFGIASSGLICVLGFYFERWRNLTLSCAFLVVGFAMFLSAPVGLYLVETFGLTQTFFILAAAELQLCVIGAVCRPSAIELDVQRRKRVDRENRTQSVLKSYIDFSLTKNFSYLFFLVSTAAWNFALTVAIIHLPNYVTKLGGGSRNIGIIMTGVFHCQSYRPRARIYYDKQI